MAEADRTDLFKNGFSYLISEDGYNTWIVNWDYIGRPDGQFGIPPEQMDALMAEHPDDPRAWEDALGMHPGDLGEHPIRVDVNPEYIQNLREATPKMSGSNDKFLGTGKVPGGQDEMVIDQFPNPELYPEVGSLTSAREYSIELTETVEIVEEDHTSMGPAELPALPAPPPETTERTSMGPDETELDTTKQVEIKKTVETTTKKEEETHDKHDGIDNDGMEE
jgi:hypothetical protein